MRKSAYYEEMTQDIKEYLEWENIKVTEDNREELEESLYDTLWVTDSVTGNASGSYTFNRSEAEEKVKDNLPLCIEACEEFCISAEDFGQHVYDEEWEYLDVTIRCYILGEVLHSVLEEVAE